MSEHEKQLKIGKLVEVYSDVKGRLTNVTARLQKAQRAYSYASLVMQNNFLKYINGTFNSQAAGHYGNQGSVQDLPHLLSYAELAEAFEEKNRLEPELAELRRELSTLAPHLL
ncbi:MAG: hypothetical protein PW735_03830 [Acidobacteriaceae bacterium]|nr:hypothetical protein [Acidobacteriaceae bacterium]